MRYGVYAPAPIRHGVSHSGENYLTDLGWRGFWQTGIKRWRRRILQQELDRLGCLFTPKFCYEDEREIHSRGDAATRDDVAVPHDAPVFRNGTESGQHVPPRQ
ncbi:hypothetical protein C7399_118122 [Paraburkholderia tropica]|uniref:Transposase n=1 Tax=Paraburkholderia tropica TaxID=92647 RepID=A0ABX5MIW8_9BURK|nr:hypothetical protein C7400_117124 [Paraburkholderia tropica]PZW76497.1 hypothetical protein C7399_118122 [Paraburkholderia tropica]